LKRSDRKDPKEGKEVRAEARRAIGKMAVVEGEF
jgi:hypothetical protein